MKWGGRGGKNPRGTPHGNPNDLTPTILKAPLGKPVSIRTRNAPSSATWHSTPLRIHPKLFDLCTKQSHPLPLQRIFIITPDSKRLFVPLEGLISAARQVFHRMYPWEDVGSAMMNYFEGLEGPLVNPSHLYLRLGEVDGLLCWAWLGEVAHRMDTSC